MPETRPQISLGGQSLAALASALEDRSLPPVERWNPINCGDSAMRIGSDGTWFHMESPIPRPAMVRLFSSVLRREPDGSYVLVTPLEKLSIAVDVTPFRALAFTSEGEGDQRRIAFEIDHSDAVIAGSDHPIRFVEGAHGPEPRVVVRGGLEAQLARPVYYELADLALAECNDPSGLWSDGVFFAFPA
jgi:hypothetical protein